MAILPVPFGNIVGYINLATTATQATPFPDLAIGAPVAVSDTRIGFDYTPGASGVQFPLFSWSGPQSGDVVLSGTMTSAPGMIAYLYAWSPSPAVWGSWEVGSGQTTAEFNTTADPLPLPVDTFFLYPTTLAATTLAATFIDNFTLTGGDPLPVTDRDINVSVTATYTAWSAAATAVRWAAQPVRNNGTAGGVTRVGWAANATRSNPTTAAPVTAKPTKTAPTRLGAWSAGPTYLEKP